MARSSSFGGLRVAAFESRRETEMTRLLESAGAVPFVSAAMREAPLEENQHLLDFAREVVAGRYDIFVLTTGVGFRLILRSLESHDMSGPFIEALRYITTIARGPKPVAALRQAGVQATIKIGEPNTWRDILAACRDGRVKVDRKRVAVQEYGLPNQQLVQGLEALGARVDSVPVYEWRLPEDLGPLERNIARIIDGESDVVLFTSSRQVVHVLMVAQRLGVEQQFRAAFRRLVVGSIGPTTSETLADCGFGVDLEPAHARLGQLVLEAAARAPGLVQGKAR